MENSVLHNVVANQLFHVLSCCLSFKCGWIKKNNISNNNTKGTSPVGCSISDIDFESFYLPDMFFRVPLDVGRGGNHKKRQNELHSDKIRNSPLKMHIYVTVFDP